MHGEERAWDLLSRLEPRDVCDRCLVEYLRSEDSYVVRVLGSLMTVVPKRKMIAALDQAGELILQKVGYFLRLSILHYLSSAQVLPLAGHLVRPSDLKVGTVYFSGSHTLPLQDVAARYGYERDIGGFLEQGRRFGGEQRLHGDVAVMLLPFPRLPVTLVLWCKDDEFPARADLLFDATCERHLPVDILWSVAMLSAKLMLTDFPGK